MIDPFSTGVLFCVLGMIHFVQGKPGGGKTLYALKLIVAELVTGNRRIVTNVALKLPELNEYLQKTYPHVSINLFERVRILQESELREFWKFRAPAGENYETWPHGALIVLDEVHLYFNARKWMDTGEDCLHYLSQHRKLGDDVICVTQHPDNVDKQFRSVAQDFSVIRNGYTQKLGWFRGLPAFTRRTYSTQPSGGVNQQPFEVAHFRLDAAGLAKCYDTAAGVGVLGRSADTQKKKSGLHPGWFLAGGIAAACVLGFAPKFLMDWRLKKTSQTVSLPSPPRPPAAGTSVASSSAKPSTDLQHGLSSIETADALEFRGAGPNLKEQRPERTAWVRGWVQRGEKINVVLSDGRTITEEDGTVAARRRNYVDFANGDRLWLAGVEPKERSEGAGGSVPPDRQRAEAAAEAIAEQAGPDRTAGYDDDVRRASSVAPNSSSTEDRSFPVGQTRGSSARMAPTVIKPRVGSSLPGLVPKDGADDFRKSPRNGGS